MLLTLGDGNWNGSEKEAISRDRSVRGVVSGNSIMRHYFGMFILYFVYFFKIIFRIFNILKFITADVMESLTIAIDFKAKSYKKTALTCIFLLNNYHYILKSIRTQFFSVLDQEIEYKYEKMVKRYNDGYQDTYVIYF